MHKVPGFTLPFNISTSILLACAAHVQSDRIVLAPGLAAALPAPFAPPAPDPRDVAWAAWGALDVLVATLRGVSQVLLVADARAGAAIALGMALCSPISAAAGVAGAAIGVLTAFAFGADPAEAYAGAVPCADANRCCDEPTVCCLCDTVCVCVRGCECV